MRDYNDVTVLRWRDGDTVMVRVKVQYDHGFYHRGAIEFDIAIRVRNLKCAEVRIGQDSGIAAKQYAEQLAPPGAKVRIKSFKDETSFDRFVADIQLTDGRDFASVMKRAGHEHTT